MDPGLSQVENCKAAFIKRKEIENVILKQHVLRTEKLETLKNEHKNASTRVADLQGQFNIIEHKIACTAGDISRTRSQIETIREEISRTWCEIDELRSRKLQAEVIKEKDEKSFQLIYDDMDQKVKNLNEFWEQAAHGGALKEKQLKKIELETKLSELKSRIIGLQFESTESKLYQEINIFSKKYAAFERRTTKQIDELKAAINSKRALLENLRKQKQF